MDNGSDKPKVSPGAAAAAASVPGVSIIKPTIGRKVWLYVSTNALEPEQFDIEDKQPFDATIVYVRQNGNLNVAFYDHSGKPGLCLDVPIYDPKESDTHMGGGSPYATWMPFQVGQAKVAGAVPQTEKPANHASDVLYPAIDAAMKELQTLPMGFNDAVNRAFNHLHRAYWSECPVPASAEPLRPVSERRAGVVGSRPNPAHGAPKPANHNPVA